MATDEACGLWIEQRIEEEQERGTSHPEIGRLVGEEIMVMFETQIEARTLEQRSRRTVATNVATPLSHEKPTVTPPSDSETQTESSLETPPKPEADAPEEPSVDETTHGGKRKGAGAPAATTPRKKSFSRFWSSITNQLNKLANRIMEDGKGGFPITENLDEKGVAEMREAFNLLNHCLKGVCK